MFAIPLVVGASTNAHEAEMNLFRLRSEKEHGEVRSLRTWLVVAGSLYEAMSLVPENFAVKTVKVEPDAVAGPARVIGSMGAPIVKLQPRGVDRRPSAGDAYLAASSQYERAEP